MAKAAATLLTNEKARKGLGWAIAAILSPIIVAIALLCALGSGAVSHNISAAQLCFQDGPLPGGLPAEYQACIEQTRASFAELDTVIAGIQSNMDEGNSLDPIRVTSQLLVQFLWRVSAIIGQKQKSLVFCLEPLNKFHNTRKDFISVINDAIHITDKALFRIEIK